MAHARPSIVRLHAQRVCVKRTGKSACATKTVASRTIWGTLLIALAHQSVPEDSPFAETAKDGAPGKPARGAAR